MKKILSIILTAAMISCFTGNFVCADETSSSAEEQSITVGFALNDLDEAQSVIYSYFEERCKEINITPVLANAAGNIDQQLTDIENLVTSGVDVLVVSALDSNAVVDAVNAAREAGVLVVDYIMGINGDVDVHFGYSFYDMAAKQADYLIDYLESNPEETIQLGYIWGSNSMELCQTLDRGFKETLESSDVSDRCKIVVEGTADWAADKAITLTEDWMQAYPEINCIVTQSDAMTAGAVEAIRAAGADPADYITIGKDGGVDAVKSIASGGMTAAIYCSQQLTGEMLADTCYDLYTGAIAGPNAEARISEFETITAENVADYE